METIKKAILSISLSLNIALGAGLFNRYHEASRLKELSVNLMDEIKAVRRSSFSVGCIVAIRTQGRISDDDPMLDIYAEWCTKNANSFAVE